MTREPDWAEIAAYEADTDEGRAMLDHFEAQSKAKRDRVLFAQLEAGLKAKHGSETDKEGTDDEQAE